MKEINDKIKIITYIDRVNFISKIFIQYYSCFFKKDEFVFLINKKTYESITNNLILESFNQSNFIMVENDFIGFPSILNQQNKIINDFVNENHIVVYVDIDEILYHNNLRSFIINSNDDLIIPKGIVIIPNIDEEILNVNKNILEQRKYCVFDDEYHSKVRVLKTNYTFEPGHHNKPNNNISSEIFLIDFSKCCYSIMVENNNTSKLIYEKSTDRYSTTNISEINLILNNWRKKIQKIPLSIIESNLI